MLANALLKKGSHYFIRIQERFLYTKNLRICLLASSIIILFVFHLAYSYFTIKVESRTIKKTINEIVSFKKTTNLIYTNELNGCSYNREKNVIEINRNETIDIIMIEATISKGKMIVAAEENNKVLHWQWDWRFIESEKKGKNYFILHIPSNMYRNKYNLHLIYEKDSVKVNNVYICRITSEDEWVSLLYNDVFYIKDKLLTPKHNSGYGISPRKLSYPFQ